MKSHTCAMLAVVAFLAACSGSGERVGGGGVETTTGSVYGRLLFADGRPCAGARVAVSKIDGAAAAITTESDSNGEFRQNGVPYGAWLLSADKIGSDTFHTQKEFRLDSSGLELGTLNLVPSLTLVAQVHPLSEIVFAEAGCWDPIYDPWPKDSVDGCRVLRSRADARGAIRWGGFPRGLWQWSATSDDSLVGRGFVDLSGRTSGVLGGLEMIPVTAIWIAPDSAAWFMQFGSGLSEQWETGQRLITDSHGRFLLDAKLQVVGLKWHLFRDGAGAVGGIELDSVPRSKRL